MNIVAPYPGLSMMLLWNTQSVAQATSTKGSHFFYTSSDAVKIHYKVFGTGYPVLLVHGFISDGQSWKLAAIFNDELGKIKKPVLVISGNQDHNNSSTEVPEKLIERRRSSWSQVIMEAQDRPNSF